MVRSKLPQAQVHHTERNTLCLVMDIILIQDIQHALRLDLDTEHIHVSQLWVQMDYTKDIN